MESALTLVVWVGLVIVGPPVLLFWMIRRRRRRAHDAREASPAPASAANAVSDSSPVPAEQTGYRFSFPYGLPLVLYPIIAIAIGTTQGNWLIALLLLLCVVLAVVFTREAFSSASYEKISGDDASLNLLTWRINWLVFFALPPALLALFGAARLLL